MAATIRSANARFKINALLTENALAHDGLRIIISDGKKADKSKLLFSPQTKNSPTSVRLTHSWHIMDIEYCMRLLEPYNHGYEKLYTKLQITNNVLNDANELEYMLTGKPGKFKLNKGKMTHGALSHVKAILSDGHLLGVVMGDASGPKIHLAKTRSVIQYMFDNGNIPELSDTYYGTYL